MSSSTAAAVLYAAAVSSTQTPVATPQDAKELRHHIKDGKGFTNPWSSFQEMPTWKLVFVFWWRRLSGKSKADTTPPTVTVHKPRFLPSRETGALRATWLGHACYYVEFPGGFRALFDPVFEARCAPYQSFGPKRYTDAPCEIEDIPYIDAVIISHNHYDHMSYPSLKKIHQKHPNAQFFVPLANKTWLDKWGIKNVTELDWWESRSIVLSKMEEQAQSKEQGQTAASFPNSMIATIGCLPCQHMSSRVGYDKCHSLWSSWSVESGGKKIWFGGDTGYRTVEHLPEGTDDYDPSLGYPHCPAFKEIGELRGPFDLGLIPIGAYEPRFIMSPMHANPFDSVNIFVDTRCKRALGMHWGTWVLTEEAVLEPPRMLKDALQKKGIPQEGVFDVCDIGESREFEERRSM